MASTLATTTTHTAILIRKESHKSLHIYKQSMYALIFTKPLSVSTVFVDSISTFSIELTATLCLHLLLTYKIVIVPLVMSRRRTAQAGTSIAGTIGMECEWSSSS